MGNTSESEVQLKTGSPSHGLAPHKTPVIHHQDFVGKI